MKNEKIHGGLRTKKIFKKSTPNLPLISVITAVYNGEKFLEKSIKSVLSQYYGNIEYIIIDGNSSDKTLEIIKTYENKIDYFLSEEDNGIYEALNKGLKLCKGEYICILNGDDYLKKYALQKSLEYLLKNECDYLVANVKFINKTALIRPIFPLRKDIIYQQMPYPHVSLLAHKNIYKQVGFFDTNLKIASDHDMALRIIKAGFKACYLNEIIAELEPNGISSDTTSIFESRKVAIKNGRFFVFAYAVYFVQIFKFYLVKILPLKAVKQIQKMKKSRFS